MLTLQTRILQKMFGVSCGERFIVDHGGLGKNPIWRLQTRVDRADGKATKLLRIKEIDRNVGSEPVYDISTQDHFVYLPEADVTVSNCDDQATLLAGLLMSIGHDCSFVLASFTRDKIPSHVFTVVNTKKYGAMVVDPVANVETAKMLREMTGFQVINCQQGVDTAAGIVRAPFQGWDGLPWRR